MAVEEAVVRSRRATPRKKARGSASPKVERGNGSWFDEALSVVFCSSALFLLISFLSYHYHSGPWLDSYLDTAVATPQENLMGPVGHLVGSLLSGFLGWCSLVLVAWCGWFALYFWNYDNPKRAKSVSKPWVVLLGFIGMLVFACALAAIVGGRLYGGSLGESVGGPMRRFFSIWGASLIATLFLLLSVAMATRSTLAETAGGGGALLLRMLKLVLVTVPVIALRVLMASLYTVYYFAWRGLCFVAGMDEAERGETEQPLPPPRLRKRAAIEPLVERPELPQRETKYEVIVNRRTNEAKAKQAAKSKAAARKVEQLQAVVPYALPAIDLLTRGEPSVEAEDDNELRQKSLQIESKLRDFDIMGRVTHVHPGPVITLFEFEPAPGVKVGKIASLQDDLAMSLRASSIRIIAPIPRRGTVGIEVPNRNRDLVRLRDLLESEAFQTADSILTVPLGKDTSGDPVVADVAKMPHLLMAGATGTGKSVCINTILVSLLYRASPDDLGLILIDPKILELSVYEDIPHLRVPVVVAPRQAKAVLSWAVREMERRYRLMQRFGVRSIDGYNKVVAGEWNGDGPAGDHPELLKLKEEAVIEEGDAVPDRGSGEEEDVDLRTPEQLKPLPKIVIVIDELADLMLAVGREIEELITRLAQKARASGIHLILATQRPSVDVITGLIKANFPARLSFRVSSKYDSRTILDTIGAERLLGRGDILFMQPGAEALKRLHGAFVSDNEVKRVVDSVKKNGPPRYDEAIMKLCEKALEEERSGGESDGDGEQAEYDDLYDKAVELVVQKGQASTSMIQRVFRIGYNRAARIIEMMERDGVIGPMDGVKPREVLVPQAANDKGDGSPF